MDVQLGQTSPSTKPGEYVVVARRYRPQTFDQLIGQEHVAQAMSNAITTGRVGHAYLFTGARGVGKTSAARILAKSLDCVHGPTPTPCNQCDICQSVSAGSDVDVLEIDGASNRGIDEIRQLRQNVNIRPSRARFKIYIIDEVHMLTAPAFNALLKTLEEPPEHVKFIFCTTEANKIPITILSRCQRFDFAGIRPASIVARLTQIVAAEGVTAEPAALEMLARRANGSMRDSQSLLEQLLSFCGRQITMAEVNTLLGTAGDARLGKLVQYLVDRNAQGALSELDAAITEGVDIGQLLEQLLGYFRDCMAAAVGCSGDQLLFASADEVDTILAASKQLGLESILAIVQIIDHTLNRLRYSTQGRILAELALVRIASLENLDDLGGLIAELRGDVASTPSSGASRAPLTGSTSATAAAAKKKADSNGAAAGESQPTAPARPLTAENAADLWQDALATLPELLAQNLSFCEGVALGLANSVPNRLVVSFRAKYTSLKAFCERPEQLGKLERALSELCGGPVKVEFAVVADTPAEPKPAPPARPNPAAERQRMAESAEHPLVRRATELFDARMVRVEQPGSDRV